MPTWPVSVIQLGVGEDLADNLADAESLVRQALRTGPRLVLLPENFAGLWRKPGPILTLPADAPLDHPVLAGLVALSRAHPECCLVLGGVPIAEPGAVPDATRHFNSLLAVKAGALIARYDKVHLFDAVLPDGTVLDESLKTRAGRDLVVLDLEGVRVGLSICYDLRFPELYAALAASGAQVLLVPAAFTVPTGVAHWEVLLRARAIETQCFVLAAAQVGRHHASRSSWGQSMIIDPWGTVLAEGSCGLEGQPSVLCADLNLQQAAQVRERMPVARHHVLGAETSAAVVPFRTGDE